jgi:hypothetical protein
MTDEIRRLADAILYEGYILWPYRRSAPKNQRRWMFGGVFPPAHSAVHPDDPSRLQAEVLLAGSDDVEVTVRFLQVVERSLEDAAGRSVRELLVGGQRVLAWDEAMEREVVALPGRTSIDVPGAAEREQLAEEAGAIIRSWKRLCGHAEVAVVAQDEVFRVTVRVENETPWDGASREDALRHAFCSTHVVLHTRNGAFRSATESKCGNEGLWPVLVGSDGAADTMLAAPIILGDYPQIAPESPGDLFDATEIDKLLILNVLALSPEEQEEMRATDPRAREILDRCASLSPEELMRLHGAIRDLRPVSRP